MVRRKGTLFTAYVENKMIYIATFLCYDGTVKYGEIIMY